MKGVKIMNNEFNPLITLDELCEVLMIGKNTAYKLLASGEIKSFRLGRNWKIPRDSVAEYIRKQSNCA